jgi:uncharacterized cupin superfamily protein
MGFTIFRPDKLDWQPPKRGDQTRRIVPLSDALHESRANMWRLPPGTHGARHLERAQEEVFVVLEGTLTLMLGDPAERVELPAGSVAVVEVGTALQQRNESGADVVLLAVGAPPVQGQAEHLPDID